jgi:hypothetical protein
VSGDTSGSTDIKNIHTSALNKVAAVILACGVLMATPVQGQEVFNIYAENYNRYYLSIVMLLA